MVEPSVGGAACEPVELEYERFPPEPLCLRVPHHYLHTQRARELSSDTAFWDAMSAPPDSKLCPVRADAGMPKEQFNARFCRPDPAHGHLLPALISGLTEGRGELTNCGVRTAMRYSLLPAVAPRWRTTCGTRAAARRTGRSTSLRTISAEQRRLFSKTTTRTSTLTMCSAFLWAIARPRAIFCLVRGLLERACIKIRWQLARGTRCWWEGEFTSSTVCV